MSADTTLFLEPHELKRLTGKAQKSKQAEQLRKMGIPFYLNAAGQPIVARSVIEGGRESRQAPSLQQWRPAVLGA